MHETWDLGAWWARGDSYDQETKKFRIILQCGTMKENLVMPPLPTKI